MRRPGFLMRVLFRGPLLLYRLGLGGLMPGRLMLLTTGRRTGRPHRVVVDVVHRDKANDSYYIASGYGDSADWYLNLRANPKVCVQVGWREFIAKARMLPEAEAENLALRRWRAQGGLMRRYMTLSLRMVGLKGNNEENYRDAVRAMKFIALEPDAAVAIDDG